MAYKLPEDNNAEQERVGLAVEEIARSANLRFLFRSLLAACGHGSTPEGSNAISTARAIGRHSVASDIIATILEHRPELYPALILEDLNEQKETENG